MELTFSLWSAVALAALLLPNLLYVFFKPRNPEKVEPPKPFLGWLEQLGRMGCILLMCIGIGPFQFGFRSAELAVIWMITMAACIAGYWGLWVWYFVNGRQLAPWSRMPMAIVPSAAFLLTGGLCLNMALLLFAAIFAFAHCYNTYGTVRQLRAQEHGAAKRTDPAKKKKNA